MVVVGGVQPITYDGTVAMAVLPARFLICTSTTFDVNRTGKPSEGRGNEPASDRRRRGGAGLESRLPQPSLLCTLRDKLSC